ncbi:MAG: FAD-dependent oxidoreductase [Proteobacteria bacterium]|nr:FAD-dependent oxidoreductase [Pseudomonadota bacterium]
MPHPDDLPILILGTGLAGYNLAREIRKLDKTVPLVLVSRDAAPFYSKPMLSNALAGGKTAESLVMKSADRMAEELGTRILAHTQVVSIDTTTRQVSFSTGEQLAYRDLVLAVGADPIRLPLAGDCATDVLSVNDLDDFARFSARLDGVQRIAILGGGLIGCEFANDLLARCIVPTILDPAPWPLGRLLPEAAGHWFQQRLEAAGVRFRMGTAARSVARHADGYRLDLDDGSQLDVDLVLSAVGLRPRTGIAAAAGLATNRGIVVDRRLAASAPNVFAIGDCAEVDGLSLPFVMPIMQQVRTLAQTLAGTPTDVRYPAMPVLVKTPAVPTVVAPPPAGSDGTWQVDGDTDGLTARFVAPDGSLRGFAVLGSATTGKQALTAQLPPTLG